MRAGQCFHDLQTHEQTRCTRRRARSRAQIVPDGFDHCLRVHSSLGRVVGIDGRGLVCRCAP
jgi:hypothetical protein